MGPMFSETYKRYVLGTLTLVVTLNYVDRGVMVLLLQPIKQDLQLSDTQLGFLTGIAFGIFYAILGIPIARWADRGNRVTIAALAIGLWGVTVMCCLFVTSFIQLVLARVAAGVGESGCVPPTYSLVGDYFTKRAERARAMAIYWLSNPLSVLISFIAGGWLNERYGWRVTFFLMGVPGLLLAVIVKMTVIELRINKEENTRQTVQPMIDVLVILWRQRSSRHLILAIILFWTMSLGLGPWYAAFLMRSHGMGSAELGLWLGLIFGISGTVGIALGGYVAARWFFDNEKRQMHLSAITVTSVVPCFVLFLILPQKHEALAALIPFTVAFNFFLGPTFALMQRLVPNQMRATTLAVVLLLANLIGMGLGPQIVGMGSDLLIPYVGHESLRYAMLSMSFVALWSAYHFWKAGGTIARDLIRDDHGLAITLGSDSAVTSRIP
jgi:MFS family permease